MREGERIGEGRKETTEGKEGGGRKEKKGKAGCLSGCP